MSEQHTRRRWLRGNREQARHRPAPGLGFARVKEDIQSQTAEELEARLKDWGQPSYRAGQVLGWIYGRKAGSWDAMTNLPQSLRERLAAQYDFHPLGLVRKQGSADTTQKFLWKLRDGAMIESVLIPANPALYGDPSDRQTLCVSTQVGCAYGCRFCASGLDGWKRNLDPGEIVGQALAVERWHATNAGGRDLSAGDVVAAAEKGRWISNLVIMGMGEPLANYDHLLKALRILNASWAMGIGARKITISTSGLVPQIRKLAEEPQQYRLAISLHGATDDVRSKIMPVNRKYPLKELIAACEYYQKRKGRMLTFEYILIAGLNDGPGQAMLLATLARRLNARINLIPYNRVEGLPWERPTEEAMASFLAVLERQKVSATLRREKGHDIDAACGQLRLREMGQGGA